MQPEGYLLIVQSISSGRSVVNYVAQRRNCGTMQVGDGRGAGRHQGFNTPGVDNGASIKVVVITEIAERSCSSGGDRRGGAVADEPHEGGYCATFAQRIPYFKTAKDFRIFVSKSDGLLVIT